MPAKSATKNTSKKTPKKLTRNQDHNELQIDTQMIETNTLTAESHYTAD